MRILFFNAVLVVSLTVLIGIGTNASETTGWGGVFLVGVLIALNRIAAAPLEAWLLARGRNGLVLTAHVLALTGALLVTVFGLSFRALLQSIEDWSGADLVAGNDLRAVATTVASSIVLSQIGFVLLPLLIFFPFGIRRGKRLRRIRHEQGRQHQDLADLLQYKERLRQDYHARLARRECDGLEFPPWLDERFADTEARISAGRTAPSATSSLQQIVSGYVGTFTGAVGVIQGYQSNPGGVLVALGVGVLAVGGMWLVGRPRQRPRFAT